MSGAYLVGNGYVGSSKLEISKAGEDILNLNRQWIYDLNFNNLDDCTIIVNNDVEIFLYASQGFKTNVHDQRISSLKIKENDVRYFWNGKYIQY